MLSFGFQLSSIRSTSSSSLMFFIRWSWKVVLIEVRIWQCTYSSGFRSILVTLLRIVTHNFWNCVDANAYTYFLFVTCIYLFIYLFFLQLVKQVSEMDYTRTRILEKAFKLIDKYVSVILPTFVSETSYLGQKSSPLPAMQTFISVLSHDSMHIVSTT